MGHRLLRLPGWQQLTVSVAHGSRDTSSTTILFRSLSRLPLLLCLCVLRVSLCWCQAKIQWTRIGLHYSEPRLSRTARPSSPSCRSVRSASLQSSVVVLAWICSVEMTKEGQTTTPDSVWQQWLPSTGTNLIIGNKLCPAVQWMLRMRLRHQLSKESIFLDKVTVTDHVSVPYWYIKRIHVFSTTEPVFQAECRSNQRHSHSACCSYWVYFLHCYLVEYEMNTLFGLLFGQNRMLIEYSVQLEFQILIDGLDSLRSLSTRSQGIWIFSICPFSFTHRWIIANDISLINYCSYASMENNTYVIWLTYPNTVCIFYFIGDVSIAYAHFFECA